MLKLRAEQLGQHVPAERSAGLRAAAGGKASPRGPPREGRDPPEVATTCCWRTTGEAILYRPIINYADGTLDTVQADDRSTRTRCLAWATAGRTSASSAMPAR